MQANKQTAQHGEFHKTTIETDLGELPVVAYYRYYPAIPGNKTDSPEPESVEIGRVFITQDSNHLEVFPTDDWLGTMQDEILESLS
jgi:hypothetical protein